MKSYKTQIGFEFEFFAATTARDIIEDLEKTFNVPFGGKLNERWRMAFDSSIKPARLCFGHELVTPCLPYKHGLQRLAEVLSWIGERRHRTNRTTGLHVNLSFIDIQRNKNVDPVKLIVFTPCNEFLAQYKRQRNIFCKSYDSDFKKWTRHTKRQHITSWKQAAKVLQMRLQMSPDSKYRAISFHTAPANPYFEFRMIGNTGYENRFAEIRLNIEEMVEAMHISSNTRACVVEYEQAMSDYVYYTNT
jgi:hypothetical protein